MFMRSSLRSGASANALRICTRRCATNATEQVAAAPAPVKKRGGVFGAFFKGFVIGGAIVGGAWGYTTMEASIQEQDDIMKGFDKVAKEAKYISQRLEVLDGMDSRLGAVEQVQAREMRLLNQRITTIEESLMEEIEKLKFK